MKRDLPARYKIKRTEKFIQNTSNLKSSYPRVTDLINAIDWTLQRSPHRFTNTVTNYYLWVTSELASEDFPEVKILYMIDEVEKEVTLIDIEEN